MAKKSILVIGSSKHSGATKCIQWGDLVYVGDYDFLIVNTTSLTKDVLKEVLANDANYFNKLRKDIADVQQQSGIAITCILSPYVFARDPGSDSQNFDSILQNNTNNYSWSPIIPKLEGIPTGTKLNNDKSSLSKEYTNEIKGYDLLYDGCINNTGFVDRSKDGDIYTKCHFLSLLKNNVGRDVGFEITWKVHRYYDYNVLFDGHLPLTFLPPTNNVSLGIDILIKEFSQDPEVGAPEWIGEITLPGEESIKNAIDAKIKSIDSIQKEISNLEKDLSGIDIFKKLLYSHGTDLEDVVEQSFSLLGINLTKPEVSNIEDRVFETSDKQKIYVEIRGVNRLMKEGDLAQLIKRIAEKPISKDYKTRGVFVFNHENKTQPSDRSDAFHPNIVSQAKSFGICLLDTKTLFNLISGQLQNKDVKDFDKKLFNTIGVFEYKIDKN